MSESMVIIYPGDPDYDDEREICNSRFDLRPALICLCRSAGHVQEALALAQEKGSPVRVRSGGHHHEGMCSANGALVIDLSGIDHVDFGSDPVSLGPGARLESVYEEAKAAGQLFGGGGCGDVRVGGLVQGGGWGPYSRHLGMTCDRLVGVEIVTADGKVHDVTDASDPGLMRAIRGGGGGNFGVVTNFFFEPAERPASVLLFGMTWDDRDLVAKVVDEWRCNFPSDADHRLTTFCRLTALAADPGHDDHPVVIGGGFLGDFDELQGTLRRLLPDTYDHGDLPDPTSARGLQGLDGLTSHYQPGPPLAALRQRLPGMAEEDLANTCAGISHRHKVSSSFPVAGAEAEVVSRAAEVVAQESPSAEGRYYLSLHCLGGAIAADLVRPNSFAFRDRPFLLQYQAWWVSDPALDDLSIGWVRDFREKLAGITEGAFINFPDRDLADDRRDLLDQYYGDKIRDLIDVKGRVDPGDVFHFGMSIPTS